MYINCVIVVVLDAIGFSYSTTPLRKLLGTVDMKYSATYITFGG